jgi:hypothetical protein
LVVGGGYKSGILPIAVATLGGKLKVTGLLGMCHNTKQQQEGAEVFGLHDNLFLG